uniref:Protein kinase domain-containing protein n=1 Tax=Panagrellus redivivus TaxID=6233 RepID=A0A7E4ZXV7_PANRE
MSRGKVDTTHGGEILDSNNRKLMLNFKDSLKVIPAYAPPRMSSIPFTEFRHEQIPTFPPKAEFKFEDQVAYPRIGQQYDRICVFDNYENSTRYRFFERHTSFREGCESTSFEHDKSYFHKMLVEDLRLCSTNLYFLLYQKFPHLKQALFIDDSYLLWYHYDVLVYEPYSKPLRELLEKRDYRRLDDAAGQYVVKCVAEAIKYLNERRISHEDICVDSTYFDSDGTVMVGDFSNVVAHYDPPNNEGNIRYRGTYESRAMEYNHDMAGLGTIWMALLWPDELKTSRTGYFHNSWKDTSPDFRRKMRYPHNSTEELSEACKKLFYIKGEWNNAKLFTVDHFLADKYFVGKSSKTSFFRTFRGVNCVPLPFVSNLENEENVKNLQSFKKISANGYFPISAINSIEVRLTISTQKWEKYFFLHRMDEIALFAALNHMCKDIPDPINILELRYNFGFAFEKFCADSKIRKKEPCGRHSFLFDDMEVEVMCNQTY